MCSTEHLKFDIEPRVRLMSTRTLVDMVSVETLSSLADFMSANPCIDNQPQGFRCGSVRRSVTLRALHDK